MLQLRSMLATALGSAVLACAAAAGPVAAGETAVLWVAQGVPGVRVDVCVNGDPVRVGLRYGARVRVEVPALTKVKLKVRAHITGAACTGAVLGLDWWYSLDPGMNLTALLTFGPGQGGWGGPYLDTWSNTPLPITGARANATVTVHHKAKARAMVFWITDDVVPAGFGGAIGIKVTGFEPVGPLPLTPGPNLFAATPFRGEAPFMKPSVRVFADLTDHQLILVGTNADNYRWIRFGNPAPVG